MTTRNFRVNNGLSVGDITIDATANTIVGLATAAPSADGDVSNKKYVDDSIAAISTTSITTDSDSVNVAVSGTGASGVITLTANSNTEATINDSGLQLGTSGARVTVINDQDDMSGDSATALATQQSIKAYVDAEDANIASDTLTFTNKTFDANGTGNALSNIDSGNFLAGFFKDEDDMTSDSATSVASQQSIKAYVDGELAGLSQNSISQLNTSITVTDTGTNGTVTVAADGNTELVINDTDATFSGDVIVTGDLTVNGTTTTVASTNTTVTDALIEYANGTTGTPANDAGIVIERGSADNAFIGFDESEDKFKVGTGTFTGASTGNLTIATGTLVANIEGNVTGDVTGNADTATTLETARNIGGVSFNGSANINLPGVNTAGNQDTSGTAAIATTVTVADESSDTSCNILFATAASGNLAPKSGTNLTFNSSNGSVTATTFVGDLTGTATAAEYSDVAERFASDSAYEAGTVVALGGAAEITQVNEEGSDEVFGVISSLQQAAFKMNGGAGNDDTHPYIAMTGRVNVKVIGTVNKGDRLISASVPGYARAATKAECTAFNVIGRALTGKTEAGQGSVLAAVRVSH